MFIGRGNLEYQEKPLTCSKSLTNFFYHAHLAWVGLELSTSVLIGAYCIDSHKSNYHMITTPTVPQMMQVRALRYQSKRYSDAVNRRMTQYNGQKKKGTIIDLQNITQKTKARATRTPLITGGELRCSGWVASSCATCCTCSVTLVTNEERTGLWQTEHICVHLWHRYSVMVKQDRAMLLTCQRNCVYQLLTNKGRCGWLVQINASYMSA